MLRSGAEEYNTQVLKALYSESGAYDELVDRGFSESTIQSLARQGADLRNVNRLVKEYPNIDAGFISKMSSERTSKLLQLSESHAATGSKVTANNLEEMTNNIAKYHGDKLGQQRAKEIIDGVLRLDAQLAKPAEDGSRQVKGLYESSAAGKEGAVPEMVEHGSDFGGFKGSAWEVQVASRLMSQGHRVEELQAAGSKFGAEVNEIDIVMRMGGERRVIESKHTLEMNDLVTSGEGEMENMRAIVNGQNDVSEGYFWVRSEPSERVKGFIGDRSNIQITGPWDEASRPLIESTGPSNVVAPGTALETQRIEPIGFSDNNGASTVAA